MAHGSKISALLKIKRRLQFALEWLIQFWTMSYCTTVSLKLLSPWNSTIFLKKEKERIAFFSLFKAKKTDSFE